LINSTNDDVFECRYLAQEIEQKHTSSFHLFNPNLQILANEMSPIKGEKPDESNADTRASHGIYGPKRWLGEMVVRAI
jgi:hypothetical protein